VAAGQVRFGVGAGAGIMSHSLDGAAFTELDGTVTCNVSNMSPGDSRTLEVTWVASSDAVVQTLSVKTGDAELGVYEATSTRRESGTGSGGAPGQDIRNVGDLSTAERGGGCACATTDDATASLLALGLALFFLRSRLRRKVSLIFAPPGG
jgi:MYXO-CTERM domain-containing protein